MDESNPTPCSYDMIVGRDLMPEIGLDILFSTQEIVWDNASVPMQSIDKLSDYKIDQFELELMFAHDPVTTDAERIQNITDAKYSKADLQEVSSECDALEPAERK